jgi:hypothetical protein
MFKPTPAIQRLLTLPGVGLTLAVVIALEVGDVARFPTAEKLAAYAGTTPRVHASGGKTRFGPSPAIWPKRRTGSSRNRRSIGNHSHRPFRPRRISADNP